MQLHSAEQHTNMKSYNKHKSLHKYNSEIKRLPNFFYIRLKMFCRTIFKWKYLLGYSFAFEYNSQLFRNDQTLAHKNSFGTSKRESILKSHDQSTAQTFTSFSSSFVLSHLFRLLMSGLSQRAELQYLFREFFFP